jgi:uncharacterized membrane protein YhaH (DUF805 family)
MNPFRGTLDRKGFLLWTLVNLGIATFVFQTGINKSTHIGFFWILFKALFVLIWTALLVLIWIRRVQNTDLSLWWALVGLIPVFWPFFWLLLLIIPPKRRI